MTYWALRSYQDEGDHYDGQMGSEANAAGFLANLWAVTDECHRVLKPTGSLFVNLGDKYAGSGGHNNSGLNNEAYMRGHNWDETRDAPKSYNKSRDVPPKSLMGLPWRFALGLICPMTYRTDLYDGAFPQWTLRAEIVWSKPNGLPESVTDRVRRSHEQWFHLTKQGRYYAAVDEIREAHTRPANGATFGGTKSVDAGDLVGASGRRQGMNTYDALNPLGKLPSSVWTIEEDSWAQLLSGPMRFCPRCGRDLTVGSGRGGSTPRATASSGSPASASDAPTASPTDSSLEPSPVDSPSTTSVETERASDPTTSNPSPSASMSSGATPQPPATPPKPTASTATSSQSTTPTSVSRVAENAACVCEIGLASAAPSSVWTVPSEPLAVPPELGVDHFAAFPTEWPRRIVLGWSPSGICVKCGEGRVPVVDKSYTPMQATNNHDKAARNADNNFDMSAAPFGRAHAEATITGYACACDVPIAPTRPAVVLDPFAGTGTVPMVARTLGRYGIGLDLSRDYLRLATWRVFQSGHGRKAMARTDRERQGSLW